MARRMSDEAIRRRLERLLGWTGKVWGKYDEKHNGGKCFYPMDARRFYAGWLQLTEAARELLVRRRERKAGKS